MNFLIERAEINVFEYLGKVFDEKNGLTAHDFTIKFDTQPLGTPYDNFLPGKRIQKMRLKVYGEEEEVLKLVDLLEMAKSQGKESCRIYTDLYIVCRMRVTPPIIYYVLAHTFDFHLYETEAIYNEFEESKEKFSNVKYERLEKELGKPLNLNDVDLTPTVVELQENREPTNKMAVAKERARLNGTRTLKVGELEEKEYDELVHFAEKITDYEPPKVDKEIEEEPSPTTADPWSFLK